MFRQLFPINKYQATFIKKLLLYFYITKLGMSDDKKKKYQKQFP